MAPRFFDTHCHLQDARFGADLRPVRQQMAGETVPQHMRRERGSELRLARPLLQHREDALPRERRAALRQKQMRLGAGAAGRTRRAHALGQSAILGEAPAPGRVRRQAASGGGQILLCTSGRGWYQEWGKSARELHAGDVVHIPAGVKHWHGAARDNWFVHLAVEVPGEGCRSQWLEPVSEEEYARLP